MDYKKIAEKAEELDEKLTKVYQNIDFNMLKRLTGSPCPNCGEPLRLVIGKYGPFIGCSNYPYCTYTQGVNLWNG